MSWISDVRSELRALDVSRKRLARFGVLVGGVFLALAAYLFVVSDLVLGRWIFSVVGCALLISGLASPNALRSIYRVWMGFAFAMGWVVSRVILVLLFYLVVTPIGLLAKLVGKDFLGTRGAASTYWVYRRDETPVDYRKLF